jgi:Protein of unknown function (DUF2752)
VPSPSAADTLRETGAPSGTGRLHRVRGPLLLAGGLGAATLALHLRDPHESGSWGICPLYAATGFYCPGCGGLRAVNDLSNGEVLQAASSNLLLVLAVPVVAVLWARWIRRRWRDEHGSGDLARPVVVASVLVGLLVIFSVARNLPFGGWLAP